jgi:hypothetical protein
VVRARNARRTLTLLKRFALAAAVVYVAFAAVLLGVMLQPPAVIGSVFARVPWPVFAAVPMERMWLWARAGSLQVGDKAPGFDLPTLDRSGRVRLSDDLGRPVVLVFGSYT